MTTPRLFADAARNESLGWEVVVLTDGAALADGSPVAAEWDALWRRCPTATAFQHRAWLASWWSAYGGGGRLRVVVVRHEGAAVAAAALYLRRRGPLRVLRFVGAGISDYGDVLLEASHPEAAERLVRALAALGRPLDLREVAPGGSALTLLERWPRAAHRFADSSCPWLLARPFDQTVAELPKHAAQRIRAKARQLDRLGLTTQRTEHGGAAVAIDALLRLHEESWRGRSVNEEHLTERYAGHLRAAVPALVADGAAEVVRYLVDGKLVACDLMLRGSDAVGGYLYGVAADLRREVDVNTMMVGGAIGIAQERGVRRLSMLRGTEPAKLRWQPSIDENTRIVLGGAGAGVVCGTVLVASIRLRPLAKRAVLATRRLRERASRLPLIRLGSLRRRR